MIDVIAVMSGKGGVGKSTVSVSIAKILSKKYKTLILDFDICGPSIQHALGVKGSVIKTKDGFQPILVSENLDVLSFGSILKESDAVIWRGAKKLVFLDLMWNSINEKYDYVVIDTPPGVSEEHSFLAEKNCKSFIVTTPQNISLNDTQNCIEFCQENFIKILGLIENLSGFECECCQEIMYPFGKGGGILLSKEYEIPFICSISIDPLIGSLMDEGTFNIEFLNTNTYKILKNNIETFL